MSQQREMPWLQELNNRELVNLDLIKRCQNAAQAIALSIQLSGYTDETIADRLGITKGHLSKIKNCRAGITGDKLDRLSYATGNFAYSQYTAWRDGFSLVRDSKGEQIKELEDQLAKLKGAA